MRLGFNKVIRFRFVLIVPVLAESLIITLYTSTCHSPTLPSLAQVFTYLPDQTTYHNRVSYVRYFHPPSEPQAGVLRNSRARRRLAIAKMDGKQLKWLLAWRGSRSNSCGLFRSLSGCVVFDIRLCLSIIICFVNIYFWHHRICYPHIHLFLIILFIVNYIHRALSSTSSIRPIVSPLIRPNCAISKSEIRLSILPFSS